MAKRKKIKLIGRREFVDFPEWGIFGIEAKIDTGAYTSALHCQDIRIQVENGKKWLCFKLLDETHPEYNEQEHRFSDFIQKNIKSSSGETELRYIIKTLLCIGGRKIWSTVSLADRGNMRYPVLIGRKLLGKKFIIDVSKTHTGGISQSN